MGTGELSAKAEGDDMAKILEGISPFFAIFPIKFSSVMVWLLKKSLQWREICMPIVRTGVHYLWGCELRRAVTCGVVSAGVQLPVRL